MIGFLEVSGVRGRRLWEWLDSELVEIRIAVPISFNGAAELFKSRQRKTIGALLDESWLVRGQGAHLRFDSIERVIVGKLKRSASASLTKMIGEFVNTSEEFICERLLDLMAPADAGNDPFASLPGEAGGA